MFHIAPSDTASGAMRVALRDAGRDDPVLAWFDDLSCGPIDPDHASIRAAWWDPLQGDRQIEAAITDFWSQVSATDDALVVWFGRHSALELSFFLAWTDRLGARPYRIVDVTGRQRPFIRRDGSVALSRPAQSASMMSVDGLRRLIGTERPVSEQERDGARGRWRRLRQENAPFRIVTRDGLASAPVDVFDRLLVGQATTEWQRMISVISKTMGHNSEPYAQTGDVMLLTRVVALVDAGLLLADGDPWDMLTCRVRLPG